MTYGFILFTIISRAALFSCFTIDLALYPIIPVCLLQIWLTSFVI